MADEKTPRPAAWADDALELGQDDTALCLDRLASDEELTGLPTCPVGSEWRVQVVIADRMDDVELKPSGGRNLQGGDVWMTQVDGMLARNYYMAPVTD